MNMRKHNHSNALLVELLIVILFFMLGCTILIRVFGTAHTLTAKAQTLAEAMVEAQNTADALYSARDPEEALAQMGFSRADTQQEKEEDAPVWILQENGYDLRAQAATEPVEGGAMRRMQVSAAAGEEILISLPCSRFVPEE